MSTEYALLKRYDRDFLRRAICVWRGYDHPRHLKMGDIFDFASFIGFPHTIDGERIVPTHLPEVRHLIDLINGPHGHAIVKMLEIKNADKCEKS